MHSSSPRRWWITKLNAESAPATTSVCYSFRDVFNRRLGLAIQIGKARAHRIEWDVPDHTRTKRSLLLIIARSAASGGNGRLGKRQVDGDNLRDGVGRERENGAGKTRVLFSPSRMTGLKDIGDGVTKYTSFFPSPCLDGVEKGRQNPIHLLLQCIVFPSIAGARSPPIGLHEAKGDRNYIKKAAEGAFCCRVQPITRRGGGRLIFSLAAIKLSNIRRKLFVFS